jgi:hypothetical protein
MSSTSSLGMHPGSVMATGDAVNPVRSHGDTYICDQCGTSQPEPLHAGWLEVNRPSAISVVRMDDWWQQPRYFCSESCLTERLHQRTKDTLNRLEI